MLTRSARAHLPPPWPTPPHARALPGAVSLRRWLQAPGSLTARLRRHGTVSVEVIRQGRARLWPQERAALRRTEAHVREVLLRIDGRAAVWARSVTPLGGVKGPWRALHGLGSRPLAELLFERRHVHRSPLRSTRLMAHSPQHAHVRRAWPGNGSDQPDAPPHWARHSLFWRHGQALQVLEAFAPWVATLANQTDRLRR